jgi:hypothetical protein
MMQESISLFMFMLQMKEKEVTGGTKIYYGFVVRKNNL